jgi:hypothetical protein
MRLSAGLSVLAVAILAACGAAIVDTGAEGEGCQGEGCQQAPCVADASCQGDRYCHEGRCVRYGEGPRGEGGAINKQCGRIVPAGLLAPRILCEWSGPGPGDTYPGHRQVLSTPLVADFDFRGHRGSEFPTTRPSIVINTYDGKDGECGLGAKNRGANYGVLRVLDGHTCRQQHVIRTRVNGATTPAIGDVDGDGRPDIVAISAEGGLVAFRYDAARGQFVTLWTSTDGRGGRSNPIAGLCQWTGPSLADLDDDGRPEVLLEGWVYDAAGRLIDGSIGGLNRLQGAGQFPVVADIDRDSVPELVTPRMVLRWDRGKAAWRTLRTLPLSDGTIEFAAVADFGAARGGALIRGERDGLAEVAVVSWGRAWIVGQEGAVLFGPINLPGSIGGGPPTVGDFDNDGRPEFAAAGSSSYTVLDPDCAPGGSARHCPSGRTDGILWTSGSQDLSSNITGSSVFDFEGDGTAEAVYADECYARIYDGRSGEVLFSQPHSSCTWIEYPVVADVRGNFRSALIVPSNENCRIGCPAVDPMFKGLRCQISTDCPGGLPCDAGLCRCTADAQCNASGAGGGFVCRAAHQGSPGSGSTCQAAHTGVRAGVRVFGDVLDRWVGSRALWNQHAYAVTNILDGGAIPRTSLQQRNWEQPGLNNFRMNVQGALPPQAAPDLTVRADRPATCGAAGVQLTAVICDRGTAPVGDGIQVTFYEGGTPVCSASTEEALGPGMCLAVSCLWAGASGNHEVTVVVDDGGDGGGGAASECEEGNNRATLAVRCDGP